jgi:hypothetical protein
MPAPDDPQHVQRTRVKMRRSEEPAKRLGENGRDIEERIPATVTRAMFLGLFHTVRKFDLSTLTGTRHPSHSTNQVHLYDRSID